jgi:hypothetical protein
LIMKPTIYSMQFRGRAREVAPGVVRKVAEGAETRLESDVSFSDETTFREEGTIDFGDGNRVRFRTLGVGWLGLSPEPELRQGAVIWEVDGGNGRFEDAQGLITSNFLVSDTGDVTDNQFGVVFVR